MACSTTQVNLDVASTLGGGTVTFLLCAVGDPGSPVSFAELPPTPRAALTEAIAAEDGRWFEVATATVAVAFASPLSAIRTVFQLQSVLALPHASLPVPPTRIALHTGVVTKQVGTHSGHAIQLAAQLLAAANASQILLSQVTADLVRDQLPPDARLHDLGSYLLGSAIRPERVYQLAPADVVAATGGLSSAARRPHNLPQPLTSLIGREVDAEAVIAALAQPTVRLLTLTGPGGVGKTRLAIAVAMQLRERFADGIFFVDLAAFHSPELVIQQLAQTLGLADAQPQSLLTRLCDYLVPRHMLLLLDNVEQVRSVGPTLTALLTVAPQLQILATSRSALRVAGEHEYPLAPLSLPGAHAAATVDVLGAYPAVRLFIARARAARPDFELTPDNAVTVAAICQRLDGLPLAIELAAVRCKLFSPDGLLQRIERRLALLTYGAQDLPVRQQTLRATLDWSFRLLDPAAQDLLRRIAVFAGGFTFDAAEAICTDRSDLRASVLDSLAELVDHSLLRQAPDPLAEPRFTLLETTHEYAAEQLEHSGEVKALRDRHAAYFVQLAERAALVLQKGVDPQWLDRLDGERANLRAALRWLLDGQQYELAAQLASALIMFWDLRSARREGYQWLVAVLEYGDALLPATRAKTLYAAGYLARALYDRSAAFELFEASVECFRALDDQRGLARALQSLAWTQINLGGDLDRPIPWLEESLALARALDDTFAIGWALQCRGWIEQNRALGYTYSSHYLLESFSWIERFPGSLDQARMLHEESLVVRRAAGNPHEVAWALVGLGVVVAAQGDLTAARVLQEERLAIERLLGNNYGVAEALRVLGILAFQQGDCPTARTWLVECLALTRGLGEHYTTLFALTTLGEVAHAEGDRQRAATYLDEVIAGFAAEQDMRRLARLAALRAQVALEDGDELLARQLAARSLAAAEASADPAIVNFCLSRLGDSAARSSRFGWAAQLWGAAERQLAGANVRRMPVEPADRQRLGAATRQALGTAACAALWAVGRDMTPALALVPPDPPAPGGGRQTYGLTRRELEVLCLLSAGHSNAEIAARLVISPATVNTYLSTIYRKLNVSSRTAAMRFALDHLDLAALS